MAVLEGARAAAAATPAPDAPAAEGGSTPREERTAPDGERSERGTAAAPDAMAALWGGLAVPLPVPAAPVGLTTPPREEGADEGAAAEGGAQAVSLDASVTGAVASLPGARQGDNLPAATGPHGPASDAPAARGVVAGTATAVAASQRQTGGASAQAALPPAEAPPAGGGPAEMGRGADAAQADAETSPPSGGSDASPPPRVSAGVASGMSGDVAPGTTPVREGQGAREALPRLQGARPEAPGAHGPLRDIAATMPAEAGAVAAGAAPEAGGLVEAHVVRPDPAADGAALPGGPEGAVRRAPGLPGRGGAARRGAEAPEPSHDPDGIAADGEREAGETQARAPQFLRAPRRAADPAFRPQEEPRGDEAGPDRSSHPSVRLRSADGEARLVPSPMPEVGAPRPHGGAEPAAPALSPDGVRDVAGALRTSTAQGGMEVRLQLHPEALGEVRVHVRWEGGILTARLEAATLAAREALQAGLQGLRDTLHEQGVPVERLQVDLRMDLGARSHGHAPPRPPEMVAAPRAPAAAPAPAAAEIAAAPPGRLDVRI